MNHEESIATTNPNGDLQRIRDILFGAQARETADRLSRLEERLSHELQELRAENQRRADQLEALIREQTAALSESLRTEQTQREGSAQALGEALRSEIQALRNATPERTSLGDMFKELATRLGSPS